MRHFSYACKHEGCDFVGQSTTGTNSLSEHYQSNPGHKHGHVPKSQRTGSPAQPRPVGTRANGVSRQTRQLSAFEQHHNLREQFEAEIHQVTATIANLRADIEAREKQLADLRSTHTVLFNATDSSYRNPPPSPGPPPMSEEEYQKSFS